MREIRLLLILICSAVHLYGEQEFPKPFKQIIEGWTIEFSKDLNESEHAKLFKETKKALANHLQRIIYLMPTDKRMELQKLVIRVDRMHPLTNMQYHPSRKWLNDNGYDPSLEKKYTYPEPNN